MNKNLQILILNFFKKNHWLHAIVFFYLTIVLVNFFHITYNPYKKIEKKIEGINTEIFSKSENFKIDLKLDISNGLSDQREYNLLLDSTCKVTGDLHDRHELRWVKNIFLKKIFIFSKNFNLNAPYYVNIFIHSLILFLAFFLINNTFNYSKKYNYLFLAYITFIFQQYLGEYSYSIFEVFFLSLGLYASKNKKKFLFFIACILATLNRESGFIILLTWLIFNRDIKTFIIISIITLILFLLFNFNSINCLVNPKFLIPIEPQKGQVNFSDIINNSIFSNFKLFFMNFLLPFGLIFYFFISSLIKNKILFLIFILYLLAFVFAAPIHHMAIRMILLPIIFCAIHFKGLKKESNLKN